MPTLPDKTARNKQKFLDQLPTHKFISRTAKAIGVAISTIWEWRTNDEDFAKAYDEAREAINQVDLSKHIQNIDDIAFDPNIPPQTRAISSMFRIKQIDPTFRDHVPETRLIGDVTIKLALPGHPEPLQLKGGSE